MCLWQYDKNIAKQLFYEFNDWFNNLTPDNRKYDYTHAALLGQNGML